MGYDTKGQFVWPDKSIHDFKPYTVMLYALPATDFKDAAGLVEVMLAHFNKPPEENAQWMPAAGLGRGRVPVPSLNFAYGEAEHAMRNRVNPVQQVLEEKDE